MRYSVAATPTVTQGFCTAVGSHRQEPRDWVSLRTAGPMSSNEGKPELAVNQHGATVADALDGFISHAADGLAHDVRLDIATAYFNVGGYSLLAESLDKLVSVRLLLGAEPVPPERRARALRREPVNARRAELRRVGDALDSHESALAVDRDLLGFSRESDASARRLVEWLRSGRVQVRRLEDRFLHGKAFLVATHAHGVVSGSSNFTHAGLCTNLELNLGNYTPHTVDAVAGWFEELWDSAADYDLAGLFEPRFEPHPPQLIYLCDRTRRRRRPTTRSAPPSTPSKRPTPSESPGSSDMRCDQRRRPPSRPWPCCG